jgi:hypothetical protein
MGCGRGGVMSAWEITYGGGERPLGRSPRSLQLLTAS